MDNNKILGIVLIVVGALLLLNWLKIPFLVLILGIVLVAVGIMMLMGKVKGANWIAWVCIVLGGLVILADLDVLGNAFDKIGGLLVTIVAIVLIVVGILKLMNKA